MIVAIVIKVVHFPLDWYSLKSWTSFLQEEYHRRDFTEVISPNIYNSKLWEASGHWQHYSENMFSFEAEKETFALKPMNCPGHWFVVFAFLSFLLPHYFFIIISGIAKRGRGTFPQMPCLEAVPASTPSGGPKSKKEAVEGHAHLLRLWKAMHIFPSLRRPPSGPREALKA